MYISVEQCTAVYDSVPECIIVKKNSECQLGLENPMVDPIVQLNTKHSYVELSW